MRSHDHKRVLAPLREGAVLVLACATAAACHRATSGASTQERDGSTATDARLGALSVASAAPLEAPSIARDLAAPIPAKTAPGHASLRATSIGKVYDLEVDERGVTFCDSRGARALLPGDAGGDVKADRPCKAAYEPACGGGALDIEMRTPSLGPNDVVDSSYPDGGHIFLMKGHVGGCASDGLSLVVSTSTRTLLLHADTGEREIVDCDGAGPFALGRDWVAWSRGTTVFAKRRQSDGRIVAGALPAVAACSPPREIPGVVTYERQTGDGFVIDLPSFFEETMNPFNGEWGWGWLERVTLDATVSSTSPEPPAIACADAAVGIDHVTAREATPGGCFVTGTSGDKIEWRRQAYRCGRLFSIELEYDAELKAALDPVVARVSKSWRTGVGRIGTCR